MKMKLYNTLTRSRDVFEPLDDKNIRMYVCGVTPYDDPHIGNARTMLMFDVLFRLLREAYGKHGVTYARNFTDIDDKIIERARERDIEPADLANKYIDRFRSQMQKLNLLEPTHQPRVSEYMHDIVEKVDALIAKGFGYVTGSGDVMYNVRAFNNLSAPHKTFGFLARKDIEGQRMGERVAVDNEKQGKEDFLLWKANEKSATKMVQAFDPKRYGAQRFNALGRPGWHIECSVMSERLLHTPYAHPKDDALFDIHGGGEDLQFPHHCCEIAQSEALHPQHIMARVWQHVAFITVDGKKMSKSENNFIYLHEVQKKYSPEAIRLWFLQTHYRKPVDYSHEALQAAEKSILRMYRVLQKVTNIEWRMMPYEKDVLKRAMHANLEMLGEDLHTSSLISKLWEAVDELDAALHSPPRRKEGAVLKSLAVVTSILSLLGFPHKMTGVQRYFNFLRSIDRKILESGFIREKHIIHQMYLRQRHIARSEWREADRIRDDLKEKGIIVEDHGDGTITWRRS